MKFGLSFANAGPFSDPIAMAHLARTAEQNGLESIWAVEHVVIPVGYESEYPYDRSGKIPAPENIDLPDPLISLAYVAGQTTRLRLATGILILPQRHPLYVAKEVATLDKVSGGRAILGIGVGWLQEEFDALGIPFEERAARTSEAVRAIRSLWSPEPAPFEGKFFRWPKLESNPKPVQPRGVPIVVGGHTAIAAKRAARYGDGFFPGRGDAATLKPLIDVMHEECKRIGRNPKEIEVTGANYAVDLDAVKAYRELGIARIVTMPPGFMPLDVENGLKKFADEVIAKL
jgi:probable F420-dependent oxidoreductase